MKPLYIVGLDTNITEFVATKAVRMTLLSLGMPSSFPAAADAISLLTERGWVYLGSHEDGDLVKREADALEDAGFTAVTYDIDTEAIERKHAARAMTDSGATPEQVFEELAPGVASDDDPGDVAIILMGIAEGNPYKAAAYAYQLAGASAECSSTMSRAQNRIIEMYPHIADLLRQANYL